MTLAPVSGWTSADLLMRDGKWLEQRLNTYREDETGVAVSLAEDGEHFVGAGCRACWSTASG